MTFKRNPNQKMKDWLKVFILLLDEVVAIALVLVALWYFEISLPLWVAVLVALLLGAFVFVIHRKIIPSFHVKQVTGSEGMVGLVGEVIEPLTPDGVIRVESEYWKARSVAGDIAAGEEVEVLGLDKLVLLVKSKKES
jgi:membrane-bound ClpP family serine protease